MNLVLICINIASTIFICQAHSNTKRNLKDLPYNSLFFEPLSKLEFRISIAKVIIIGWTIFYILFNLNKLCV